MLRFRFGMDDLARVRFVEPSTATFIPLSAQLLRRPPAPPYLPWHRHARERLPRRARPLFDLFPAAGHVPDFLTPVTGGDGLAELYESILALPAVRIRSELAHAHLDLAAAPTWVRGLAAGDRESRHLLIEAIGSYHDACLARFLPLLRDRVHADLAWRARLLTAEGLDAVLDTLHPAVRWRSPYLERRAGCCDIDIDLGSRGLQLWPVPFLTSHPRALLWEGVPTLAYPIHVHLVDETARAAGDPLAELVGHTRAAVLRALGSRPGTGRLAQLLDISPASASLHLKALRNAGLVETRRTGKAVEHSLTGLGLRLLETTAG